MINCLHPTLIINPAVYEYVGLWNVIAINGQERKIFGCNTLKVKYLYNILKDIKKTLSPLEDYKEKYYVYDRFLNKCSVFLSVPCNKCILCLRSRQNSLVQRLQFESECYPTEPYFVTLTHNRYSLPKDNKPNLRTIQLYIKRLRNYCLEKYKTEIRYFAQGERGKKHNRTHYHFIIFGLPKLQFDDFHELFSLAWRTKKKVTYLKEGKIVKDFAPLGIVQCSQINSDEYLSWYKKTHGRELSKTDGLKYCCKYSTKDKNIQTWSLGLGKKYVDLKYRDYLHTEQPAVDLIFYDRYGGKYPVIKDRWFLQTCFTTYNRATYKFRSLIMDSLSAQFYNISRFNGRYSWLIQLYLKPFLSYMGLKIHHFSAKDIKDISQDWKRKWLDKVYKYKRPRTILKHLVETPNRNQLRFLSHFFHNNDYFDYLEREQELYHKYLQRCFMFKPELTFEQVSNSSRSVEKYNSLISNNITL